MKYVVSQWWYNKYTDPFIFMAFAWEMPHEIGRQLAATATCVDAWIRKESLCLITNELARWQLSTCVIRN